MTPASPAVDLEALEKREVRKPIGWSAETDGLVTITQSERDALISEVRASRLLLGEAHVQKRWIIIHEIGCVPNRKGPFPVEMITPFLKELVEHAAPETRISIVSAFSDGDIIVDDGREHLAIERAFATNKRSRRSRAVSRAPTAIKDHSNG